QGDELIQINRIDFDVHDIPRDRFLVAGVVWQRIRSGQVDPSQYGVAPDDSFRGEWAIRNHLIYDLAALNKIELLLWDRWPWMDIEGPLPDEDYPLLDQIAALTQEGDEAFERLQAIYADLPFKAPAHFLSDADGVRQAQ